MELFLAPFGHNIYYTAAEETMDIEIYTKLCVEEKDFEKCLTEIR